MRKLKKVLPVFLIFILILLGSCTNNVDGNKETTTTKSTFCGKEFPFAVSEDIEITDAFAYTGEFPEDGSFSIKDYVFALKVKNNSEKDLQLVRFFVTTDKGDYSFEVTTLPSDKSVIVLEKNGAKVSDDERIMEIRQENIVFFEKKLSLNSDKFEITPLDKVINIKNISQQDVTSNVYVYFKVKNINGDYLGGITFRSNAGTLSAGEFKQIPASHFSKKNCEVLFVDYGTQ